MYKRQVDESGAYKSKDADYQDQMAQAGIGTDPAQFYPAIIQSFIDAKYLPDEMDAVAGATQSFNRFKELVTAALEADVLLEITGRESHENPIDRL